MKKTRNIRVIKLRDDGGGEDGDKNSAVKVKQSPRNSKSTDRKAAKSHKIVQDWIGEHRKNKELAEKAARRLLSSAIKPSKSDEDTFSKR